MNYGELKAEIAGYLHRTDLSSEIITFITKAEQRIGRDLRVVENRIQSTETPSSGEVTLPTRFAEMRRISSGSGATLRILTPVSAHAARDFGTSGEAEAYYISDQIYLLPAADTDIDIDYYEYPETLVGAADGATRPIMDRLESLYVDGSLAEAYYYLQDWEAYTLSSTRYWDAIQKANKAAAEAYTPRSTGAYNFSATAPRGL